MLDWSASPAELVALFEELAPDAPGVLRRKMFGYPAAFVNGNMFAALHGPRLLLRLPEPALAEFLALEGATPFEPRPGRAMKGYAVAPPALLADKPALSGWLERALTGAAALPPKHKKPPRKKATSWPPPVAHSASESSQ